MEKIVIDSCVFAKLFLDEEGFEKVRVFIKTLCEDKVQILVPSIFTYEIFYIAQRYGVDLDFITNLLETYKSFNLKEMALEGKTIAKAKEIITNSSHPKSGFPSFYDASYHALAMVNECKFITADKKHYEKTKGEGFIELI